VIPVKMAPWKTIDSMISSGLNMLKEMHLADYNDKLVIVCGTTTTPGATNMIKILKV
jgi:pyruvate kinase